jgi:hypothetical protein
MGNFNKKTSKILLALTFLIFFPLQDGTLYEFSHPESRALVSDYCRPGA